MTYGHTDRRTDICFYRVALLLTMTKQGDIQHYTTSAKFHLLDAKYEIDIDSYRNMRTLYIYGEMMEQLKQLNIFSKNISFLWKLTISHVKLEL